jgi:hypothetical protein
MVLYLSDNRVFLPCVEINDRCYVISPTNKTTTLSGSMMFITDEVL